MKFMTKTALLLCGAIALSACLSEDPGEIVEPLEATSINVDGTEYVVTRTSFTKDDVTTEGWSVVVDGLAVSCPEPTKLSCENAVRDFGA